MAADKKKEAKQIAVWAQQAAKEAKRLPKMEEGGRKRTKRSRAKGKMEANGSEIVPLYSSLNHGLHMQCVSQGVTKRKTALNNFEKEDIVHGGEGASSGHNDEVRTHELLLNHSIAVVVEDMEAARPNSYTKVMSFLNKFTNGKDQFYNGRKNPWAGVDFVLIDCQENLLVHGISSSPTDIPVGTTTRRPTH